MTQLDDNDEILARLTMLEFAVEVALANMVANMREDYSANFKADFVRVSKKTYGAMTGDESTGRRIQAISQRSAEMATRLIDKVARREAEIRGRIAQGQ